MLMVFGRGFNGAALMVIDQAGSITSSFNIAKAADQSNAENILVIQSKDLANEAKTA